MADTKPTGPINLNEAKQIMEDLFDQDSNEQPESESQDLAANNESEALAEGEAESEQLEEQALEESEELELDDVSAEESETVEEQEEVIEEPESFEIKVDGKEEKVSLDELKKGYSRQASYTRKSQELAEQRKAYDSELANVTQERQQYAQLIGQLEQQLQADTPESQPDWDALYKANPIEAARQERQWRTQEEARTKKLEAIQQEQERIRQTNEKEHANYLQSVITAENAKLTEVIPEWKDNKVAGNEKGQLREWLLDQGITNEEMQQLIKADHVKLLRKAWLYDKGVKRVSKARTKQSNSKKTVRPGSSKSTPNAQNRMIKQSRQKLQKSGRFGDAVDLIEKMI